MRTVRESNPLVTDVVPLAFSVEKENRDKNSEEPITALPLSYLACARAGIEPATNVFFQAFAARMGASTVASGSETFLVRLVTM